jgi:uncharacterized phage protein gp47/JayE
VPLPDYLEPQEETTVLARILARISDEKDKSEGSFLHDPTMASALEFAMAADRLQTVFELGFVQTTIAEFLDLRAEEHGLTRRTAVAATGLVRFDGTNGTVIPAGTTVSTPGDEAVMPQEFTTDTDGTIAGGFVSVPATATTGGAAGNVAAAAIQLLDPPIAGVTGVTNLAAFTGGLDEEDDESLRQRILDAVRNPGTSGNEADYRRWALEVSGVGGVAVVPLEGGPGTVTVAIAGADMLPASAPLVTEVAAYIAERSPIGAAVTVEAGTAVPIDVVGNLTIATGYVTADVEAAVDSALQDYLEAIAFNQDDNDVRHARVTTLILDTPGVTDVTGLTLNGGTSNITITAKQVATLGTTTWT